MLGLKRNTNTLAKCLCDYLRNNTLNRELLFIIPVSDTVLNILHMLPILCLKIPSDKCYYYLHFADEDSEAQRD